MNAAVVKRKQPCSRKEGLKLSSRKRPHNVDEPSAKSVVDGSGDSAAVDSKKPHLDLSQSFALAASAVDTALISMASPLVSSSLSRADSDSVSEMASASLQHVPQVSTLPESVPVISHSVVKSEPNNRKVQHLKFSPVASVESVVPAASRSCQKRQKAALDHTSELAASRQGTIADGLYLFWPNEDSLCWLDAAMALVVSCENLRGISTQSDDDSPLRRLTMNFDSAQANFRRSRKLYRCHYLCGQGKAVTLETSVGQVSVKTGGGRAPLSASSLLGRESTVVTHVDLDDVSGIVFADDPHSASVESVSREAKRLEDNAKRLLAETRDEVFNRLQPRMHCQRGERESVLIALSEFFLLDKAVQSHFTVSYNYFLSCTCCGQSESGT